jgi:hypothetical protein
MVKRYGTSSMECENGIYVLHAEYEALEAEVRALREALSNPVAWRCDWDGKDGTGVWHQYHDAEDPLPEVWDDEVPTITPLYAAKDKP